MGDSYAESRVLAALKEAKDNPVRAKQKVIAWSYEDPRLLLALAHPHLTGIVAHFVNRVIYRQKEAAKAAPVPEGPQAPGLTQKTFGNEILKAMQSNNTPLFGQENAAPPIKRRQASQSHIDALKQMAAKSKSKSHSHSHKSGQ